MGVAAAGILAGCSSEAERQKQNAERLLDSAKMLKSESLYAEALEVVDAIDSLCPLAVDVRKQSHVMKPEMMMGVTTQEISYTDSMLSVAALKGDSLMKLLSTVKAPYEPYLAYTPLKGVSGGSDAGIYAQLSVQGLVYHIVAAAKGGKSAVSVKITDSVTGDCAATVPIGYDGERNRVGSSGLQTITLTEAESAPLGEFVAAHRGGELTLVFESSEGKVLSKVPISTVQKDGVATLYALLEQRRDVNKYRIRLEHLNRKLEVLRNQLGEFADSEP